MPTICLASNCIHYPEQLWPYLNWALSLRAAGCEVVWLEMLEDEPTQDWLGPALRALRSRLDEFELDAPISLLTQEGAGVEPSPDGTVPFEVAREADVLVDLGYLPPLVVGQYKRSVFVDLDPGQAQIWAAQRDVEIDGHDLYISIGEGVEAPDRPFPDAGKHWIYVPTPVALDHWATVAMPEAAAPYTTISHWWDEHPVEIDGDWVDSSKRAAFEPFLTLPSLTSSRLELALGGLDDDEELERLEGLGWTVRDAADVVATPTRYRDYVVRSRGELSAAKRPYVALETGWLNDRTASYLAAGRPAIVQRTITQSRSRLPDGEGLLRFETVEDAAAALHAVESDYERHARAARKIAEAHFDGRQIATRVLELALA